MKLEDVHGREGELSVARNGFATMHLEDQMAYEDYGHEDLVHQVYFKQVAEAQHNRCRYFSQVVVK